MSIMRWNDGNYWALKASIEKSHRSLIKFMKKWKVTTYVLSTKDYSCMREREFYAYVLNGLNTSVVYLESLFYPSSFET